MYRALQAIPGARVLRDVTIPAGVGRAAQIPFVVQMTGAQASGFWGTITKSVRYFIVVKEADGTLSVKIDQDQRTHAAIADTVQKAIGSAEEAATAENSRIQEQRRQEVLRQREALAAKQQHDRDVRAREVADSYSSAKDVLARLDEQRAREAAENEAAMPAALPSDPGGQFQDAILRNVTQEYAKQKVTIASGPRRAVLFSKKICTLFHDLLKNPPPPSRPAGSGLINATAALQGRGEGGSPDSSA